MSEADVIELPSADDTASKQVGRPWQKGQSGNPKGRPPGARGKLGEDFLSDLHGAWHKHGSAALERCAQSEPTQFVKVVASVLPREILVQALNVNANVSLTDVEAAKGFLEAYRFAKTRIGLPMPEPEGATITKAWRADD